MASSDHLPRAPPQHEENTRRATSACTSPSACPSSFFFVFRDPVLKAVGARPLSNGFLHAHAARRCDCPLDSRLLFPFSLFCCSRPFFFLARPPNRSSRKRIKGWPRGKTLSPHHTDAFSPPSTFFFFAVPTLESPDPERVWLLPWRLASLGESVSARPNVLSCRRKDEIARKKKVGRARSARPSLVRPVGRARLPPSSCFVSPIIMTTQGDESEESAAREKKKGGHQTRRTSCRAGKRCASHSLLSAKKGPQRNCKKTFLLSHKESGFSGRGPDHGVTKRIVRGAHEKETRAGVCRYHHCCCW